MTDKEDDDTDDDLTLVDLVKNLGTSTFQENITLPVGGLLPSHPKGPRVTARKCKLAIIIINNDEPSR
jgi:hypothetical protein